MRLNFFKASKNATEKRLEIETQKVEGGAEEVSIWDCRFAEISFARLLMNFPSLRVFGFVAVAACLVLSGCRTTKRDFTPHIVRFYLEESDHLPPSHIAEMILPVSGSHITVKSRPVFVESDIGNASLYETEFGPAVILLFRTAATTDFYRTTIANQGKRLVIVINGLPLGAYYISGPVQDGRIMFYLEVPDEELPEIVRSIQKTSDELRKAQSSGW